MLVCRETDSLGCVNCVEKGWNKMENKVTVVLADANEEFRTMLRQRMEGTGEFHVAGSTENGDQALDLVRRLRPQLLVTDVVLPGLDGFGLLRQLNQLGQGAPRTIVVSSFCSRRTVAQAMEMGVYFFLPKPVNEESLLELMRQAAAPDPADSPSPPLLRGLHPPGDRAAPGGDGAHGENAAEAGPGRPAEHMGGELMNRYHESMEHCAPPPELSIMKLL